MFKDNFTYWLGAISGIVLFLIGAIMSGLMMVKAGMAGMLFSVGVSALFGLPALYLLWRTLISTLIERFSGGLFLPGGKCRFDMEYSECKALLAKGDVEGALNAYNEVFEKDPDNGWLYLTIADIRLEHYQDYEEVEKMLRDWLASKSSRDSDDAKIVMRLVDVLLETNRDDEAKVLLEAESRRKYPKKDLAALQKRLEHL